MAPPSRWGTIKVTAGMIAEARSRPAGIKARKEGTAVSVGEQGAQLRAFLVWGVRLIQR
jgi:hypothetical protein